MTNPRPSRAEQTGVASHPHPESGSGQSEDAQLCLRRRQESHEGPCWLFHIIQTEKVEIIPEGPAPKGPIEEARGKADADDF